MTSVNIIHANHVVQITGSPPLLSDLDILCEMEHEGLKTFSLITCGSSVVRPAYWTAHSFHLSWSLSRQTCWYSTCSRQTMNTSAIAVTLLTGVKIRCPSLAIEVRFPSLSANWRDCTSKKKKIVDLSGTKKYSN